MKSGSTWVFSVAAMGCLAAPFAFGIPGEAELVLAYKGLPLAVLAAVLGLRFHPRAWRGALGSFLALPVAAAFIAFSVPLSTAWLTMEQLFTGIEVQGALAVLAAVSLAVFAVRVLLADTRLLPRGIDAAALLALTALFGWDGLVRLRILSRGGSDLAAIGRELSLFRYVVAGAVVAITLAALLAKGRTERQGGDVA